MGVLILYLLLNVAVVGFFLDKILDKMFKEDIVISFSGIILMYYLADLLMRLQLQELPTLRVQPYLHLPVRRNTVVGYLAGASILSFFNLWPFILFFPFIFKVIAAESGIGTLGFIVAIVSLTIFNNYLALYIKRKANLNAWLFLSITALLTLITLGDFLWHLYSLRNLSFLFFGKLITMPWLSVIPLLLAVAIYYINFAYLKQNLYLENLNASKASAYKNSTDYPILNRFGSVGDLVANEIKLILRNKRPNTALKMGLVFMFYGLIFYTQPKMYGDSWKVFVGMFMTGIFIINYGQFMFSWQGSHFDGILVSKTKLTDFVKAKYLLFTGVSTLAFILTLPYIYFGWKVVLIHFIMYVWNLGVNTTIVLFFANRNKKRIDLSKGASFNWEGVGATQWLLSLPIMITPYIIYVPFNIFNRADIALGLIFVIGVIGILTRPYWVKMLANELNEKKLEIAEGFRNK